MHLPQTAQGAYYFSDFPVNAAHFQDFTETLI
jgi:hypothetical protein